MSELKHKPGQFCWAELMTTDTAAAQQFYCGLAGWTTRSDTMASGGVYTTFFYEGLEAAACCGLSSALQAAGVPPHWLAYVMVEDIAASIEKVTAAGGKIQTGPHDAGQYGKFAVVCDPVGAAFSLWQPITHFGSRNGNVLGRHCWTELAVRDLAAAKDFYTKVFGWDTYSADMGGIEYVSLMSAGMPFGGMYGMPAQMDGVPPHWMVYFSVVDVNTAVQATKDAGGSLIAGPMDVPNVGTMATLRDPQGAYVSVIQLNAQ